LGVAGFLGVSSLLGVAGFLGLIPFLGLAPFFADLGVWDLGGDPALGDALCPELFLSSGVSFLERTSTPFPGEDAASVSDLLLRFSFVIFLRLCLSKDEVDLVLATTGVVPLAIGLAPLRTGDEAGKDLSKYSGET